MNVRVDPTALTPSGDAIALRLRADFGDEIYAAWLGSLRLDGIIGTIAYFSVATKFLKNWIEAHFRERLVAVATEMLGVETVTLLVRSSARVAAVPERLAVVAPPEPKPAPKIEIVAAKPDAVTAPPLPKLPASAPDRRLNFETFHVGRSNELAHISAQQVARRDAKERPLFNPLYIHGAVGLGKTHLLQAIAQGTTQRALYLTAERFMYGFAASLRGSTGPDFRERLRGIDVLIIDDIQFLQGKAVQREFCHTINAMLADGKQVVVAADRPPHELEALEDRVRSRLAGGLCVEVTAPDTSLRYDMLRSRVVALQDSAQGFEVGPDVLSYVASAIQTNGRDLDGAANRLLAASSLSGSPMTVEAAKIAIKDLIRAPELKRIKIEDIQRLVARHYGIEHRDMMSARRTANLVRPRQIAMYLCKALTLRSLPEIGRRFGGRDHTTVLSSIRRIDKCRAEDRQIDADVILLRRILEES